MIEHSEQIDLLAAAMCEVHGEMTDAGKDKEGHGYNYADLSQVLQISRPLLYKHGLFIMQNPGKITTQVVSDTLKGKSDAPGVVNFVEPGKFPVNKMIVEKKIPKQNLRTILMHKSGQWISSEMEILIERGAGMSWAQANGSCITYARRYSRSGSVGMTQADNDAPKDDDKGKDDKKDDDDPKNTSHTNPPKSHTLEFKPVTPEQAQVLVDLIDGDRTTLENILAWGKTLDINNFPSDKYERAVQRLKELKVA